MYPPTSELFESFTRHRPEGKLELIDGCLIVGNTNAGSRLLLRQILQGWKADAAVAFAPIDLWIEALKVSLSLPVSTKSDRLSVLQELETVVADIEYQPEDLIPGEGACNYPYHPHHGVRQYLSDCLHDVEEDLGGRSFGRDFVMRLGENGFTPDLMLFKSKDLNQLHSWYLKGPAELVIEVLLAGHEYCDRIAKRNYYETAGVPEYWTVDPIQHQVEFWRLIEGKYQQQTVDSDGYYRPICVPGLAFQADPLWDEENWYRGRSQQEVFILEAEPQPFQRIEAIESETWGNVPFRPHLQLEPTPIQFGEYIGWCPQAKFEFFNGKIQISYKRGTKRVLGLLLMTFGLASAVRVLPPQAWVEALKQRAILEQQDDQRKAEWWDLARRAAKVLREQYGVQRVGAIGDLVRSEPLNDWSEIKLVVWDSNRLDWGVHEALASVSKKPEIRLLNADKDYLTVDEQEAIAHELAEI